MPAANSLEEPEAEELGHLQQEQEVERVGPNSFIPIQLLGKGSFGEVYLV